MSQQPVVLLGVTGGVAAYKAVSVASGLRQRGCDLHVALSSAAAEFVTPLTFSAISSNPVLTKLFIDEQPDQAEDVYPHLYPATSADAFVVAPATANTIAKLVQGIGDDIVTCSALSLPDSCRRFFCPAMNVEMWEQDAVQENVTTLIQRGWVRIGPESGHLACGMEGYGRFADPDEIMATVLSGLHNHNRLAGRRVVILSGPTREHFDPVRYIGNPSSGKMGKALAHAALEFGATVDFISGPVTHENLPRGPRLHQVTSAEDMLRTAQGLVGETDILIYAAAVADYKPATYHEEKMPKQTGDVVLHLTNTPDIAATLGVDKKPGQVSIGFALQTGDGTDAAWGKLQRKNLDGIVLNHIDSLGADDGRFRFFTLEGGKTCDDWGRLNKEACARNILDAATRMLERSAAHA